MEWASDDWLGIHSGDSTGFAGVLCLISRRLIPRTGVSWAEIQPGRALHVRLRSTNRHIDLMNIYQHTSKKQNLDLRKELLQQTLRHAQGLPRRNLLFMGGDFNCCLPTIPDLTGNETYAWQGEITKGSQHPDADDFRNFVVTLQLQSLNTWQPKDGPTFVHEASTGSYTARIDFGFMRASTADGHSRRPTVLTEFPLQVGNGHRPLIYSITKTWQAHKPAAAGARFTYHQRLHARLMRNATDPSWHDYVNCMDQCLNRIDPQAWRHQGQTSLDWLHKLMADNFHYYLPKPSGCKTRTEKQSMELTLTNKWDSFRHFRQPDEPTLRNVFHCWHQWKQFHKHDRQHKQQAKENKHAHIEAMMQQAQQAADRHDLFGLYRILNTYCPKQRRARFQLRHATGQLASPQEEFVHFCTTNMGL